MGVGLETLCTCDIMKDNRMTCGNFVAAEGSCVGSGPSQVLTSRKERGVERDVIKLFIGVQSNRQREKMKKIRDISRHNVKVFQTLLSFLKDYHDSFLFCTS